VPGADSYQILIIDTDPADRRLTTEELAACGVKTQAFADGADALRYLEENLPDLILLALNLVGKLGDDILREIKAKPRLRAIPVVVFTNVTDAWRLRRAHLHCANLVVQKPQSNADFRAAVRRIAQFWTVHASPVPRPESDDVVPN